MRIIILAITLAGLSLLTGCTSLLSVHPLATAETRIFDEGLVGAWRDSDNETYLVRQKEGQAYEVTYAPKNGSPLQFEGYLAPVGCVRILDLRLKNAPDFTIAGHFFVRIERNGDELRFALMDSEWLRKQVSPEADDRETALLTTSSREVQRIVRQYACEAQAYGEGAELRRMK